MEGLAAACAELRKVTQTCRGLPVMIVIFNYPQ
jgi:hypothetical protein